MNWTDELDKQLSWQWENLMRPRWDGLTDEEYRLGTGARHVERPAAGAGRRPGGRFR